MKTETQVPIADGYLVHPGILSQQARKNLSATWDEAIKTGKVPVLEEGMQFIPFTEAAALRMKARRYLARLEKLEHPAAAGDPVGALGQVAVDLCQALSLVQDTAIQAAVSRMRVVVGEAFDLELRAPVVEDDGGRRTSGSVARAHILAELDKAGSGR